jgi:serine/threonine-protein kinase RsbW
MLFSFAACFGTSKRDAMGKRFFVKEFPSTTPAVAEALTDALTALTHTGWIRPDKTFSIRLCLEEALVNAVIHGNQNCPDCMVMLEMFEEGEQCRIRVKDEGEGFNVDSIEMPDCTQLGGRGVCLIKEFMDEVLFDESNKTLDMVFNRKTFSEACA